jgi:hypothetical protein
MNQNGRTQPVPYRVITLCGLQLEASPLNPRLRALGTVQGRGEAFRRSADTKGMPYKDPQKQREYQREHKRARRHGSRTPPGRVALPVPFRLRVAQDLVALLEEQIDAVRTDPCAGRLEKARCIGSLVSVALRSLEQRDLTARIEALELVFKNRRLEDGRVS